MRLVLLVVILSGCAAMALWSASTGPAVAVAWNTTVSAMPDAVARMVFAPVRVPGGIRDAHGGPNRDLRVGLGRLIVACCQCHSHRRTWGCRRGEGHRARARDTGPERVRPCRGTERPAAERRNAVG